MLQATRLALTTPLLNASTCQTRMSVCRDIFDWTKESD
jgi:hypothetical protein